MDSVLVPGGLLRRWLVRLSAVAVALVAPRIAYRFLRFEVTPLGLYVQRGWLTRSWTLVPHSRIQAVETSSGPLERALGLATVEVRTASAAAARIPGLDEGRIARLRARESAKQEYCREGYRRTRKGGVTH